jgi:pSer/pThr/pTyr-binding forkhead associated (FHA) protein
VRVLLDRVLGAGRAAGLTLPRKTASAMREQAQERFRKACGLTAPLVLACESPTGLDSGSTTRTFPCPFVLIGRTPRADLFLDNEEVSRRHAFLQAIAGKILVVDLLSRTKVYWEGEGTPRSRGWLGPRGYIEVGSHRISRSRQDAGDHDHGLSAGSYTAFDEPSEAAPVLRCALELPIRVGDNPSLWPVEGEMAMVGRAEECQLVLSDDSISRFHAALVPTPSGLWVVDLSAREGVLVSGERVRWAWLADGDTIRMGRFTFILRYESVPVEITRADVPLEAGARSDGPSGSELAVRKGASDGGRRNLAVRSGGRSLAPVRAKRSAPVEPETIVPSGAELLGPMPFPANPMAMWQQQMQLMESFHNDMILMVQMFVAMHKEHSASVRHELDMVRRLTRELDALQAKTGASPETDDAGDPVTPDLPPSRSGSARTKDRKKQVETPDAEDLDQDSDRAVPKSTHQDRRSRPASSKISSTQGPGDSSSNGKRAGQNSQIHAHLTERIAELQRQRQGYWQRILSTINR